MLIVSNQNYSKKIVSKDIITIFSPLSLPGQLLVPEELEVLAAGDIVGAGDHRLVPLEEGLVVVLQELAGQLFVPCQTQPMACDDVTS